MSYQIKLINPTENLIKELKPDPDGFIDYQTLRKMFPNLNDKDFLTFLNKSLFYEVVYVLNNSKNGDTDSQEKPTKKQSK